MARANRQEEAQNEAVQTPQIEDTADNSEAKEVAESEIKTAAGPESKSEGDKKDIAAETKPEKKLFSISELAMRHRLASWQTAALLRMMGWQDDRLAGEDEFRDAMAMLQNRRIGGGRM